VPVGCLTAYRRHVLIELEPILEDRNLLGVAISTARIGSSNPRSSSTATHAHDDGRDVLHEGTDHPCAATSTAAALEAINIVDFMSHRPSWQLHRCCAAVLSMLMLLLIYPFVIATHVANGQFFELAMFHVEVIALSG